MDIFYVLFYQPTFNLLMVFTNWFGSLGLSIVLIALIAKLITLPMTNSQIKNAEKNKDLQVKFKELKKKYKHNQEKLTAEMAKLQAEVLPGQLGGCLSIIIFIVLFIQIRGVILDLVNRGFHAYNEVAYTQNLEKKEDYIKYNLPEPLPLGKNTIQLNVTASNGKVLNKVYEFEVVENKAARIEELKTELNNRTEEQKSETLKITEERANAERDSDIAIYNKDLEAGITNVTLGQFLFFTTDSARVDLIENNNPDLTFYVRPPSNETTVTDNTSMLINGNDVSSSLEIQQGDKLNLEFAGVNLSKVANDFDIFNLSITAPYILLSVGSGVAQYFVSKLYAAGNTQTASTPKKDEKKGKKKDEEDEPDFAEIMAESSKQMNLIFPIFTIFISLGYFGGASFIPMGVTLFWTAQNTFVIIQQVYVQRQNIKEKLSERFNKVKLYWNKAD